MADPPEDDATPWERTLEDLHRLEEELEAAGWDVLSVPADHVAPEAPASGDTDRFGLVYVVPGNLGDEFRDAMAACEFSEFEVHRQRVGNRLYLVTRVSDPSAQRAVLLAGTVDLTQASALIEAAEAEGRMYTHVQRLDQTHLGSFRHDDPSLFFDELS